MTWRRAGVVVVVGSSLLSCAAPRKSAEAPAAASQPSQEAAPAGQGQPGFQAAPPPPPSPAGDAAPGPRPRQPAASDRFAPPPNRSAAMAQAANEIEASQRELDVAGGDCRNACRALGSMDRAAGRLCGLAQSTDDQRRCEDAKSRVYSARDRVRNTCGSCPDVSVERGAPIPSR